VITITQIGSDFPTLWILARGYGHAGWGADGRVYIKLIEAKSFLSEAVNVRSLGMLVSKAGKVAPSHIVNEDEDNIRTLSDCI
jgi:hypothetical protein